MNLQKLLYVNKGLTDQILQKISPGILEALSKKRAYSNFKMAVKKVVAYQKFLADNNVNPNDIKSTDDFSKLPIMDKQNYISKYNFDELLYAPIEYNYTIEESSGFSGKSSFWPRFDGQDDLFADYMELGLIKTFHIDKKSTLLINTFALGTWVTGFKFGRGAAIIANRNSNKLTIVNTGIKKDSVFKYLEKFTRYYDQIILAGYPPYLKEVIEEALLKNYLNEPSKINIIAGGEGFPEEWRDYMANLLHCDIEKFDQKILSAYGAADIGLEVGYEQPITVLFRRALMSDKELSMKTLNSDNSVPHFFQYNPLNIFVETKGNELIFTSRSGIPPIRYNLHDSGGIISYSEMINILSKKFDISKLLSDLKPFKLPVLYLQGRTDGVIPVSSANVYIEQIKSIVNSTDLQKYISGKFYAFSIFDKNFKPEFHITLETDKVTQVDEKFVQKFVTDKLCKINQDYKEFYISDKAQFKPRITFMSRKEFNEYTQDSIKIKYLKK